MKTKTASPRYVTVGGKRFVMLPEAAYRRLAQENDTWEPPLPEPDQDGNYPALEYALISLARDILRARRSLGITQAELARRAGIRPATLARIEQGQDAGTVKTIDKIDRALKRAEREKNGKG